MSVDTIEKAIRSILMVDSMTRLEKTISGVTGIVETADGMAFVDPMTDISEYDGKRIDVIDTADKIASGYIHSEATDDPFVQMTYNAGPSGISVADNDNINVGTGNFTLVWKGALPDWTPSEDTYLIYKLSGSAGAYYFYGLRIATTGIIQAALGRNDGITFFSSTANPSLTNGTEHEIVAVIARETSTTAGSIVFYVDRIQLGSAVAITAAAPVSLDNTGIFYISSHVSRRFASTNKSVILYNRALSAAEVLSLYQSGIADEDKWGNQTPIYTSNFSAGVDGWAAAGVTLTGNTDSINGSDDWLKVERTDVASGRVDIYRDGCLISNKNAYVTLTIYNDPASTIQYFNCLHNGGNRPSTVIAVPPGTEVTATLYWPTANVYTGTRMYIYPCTSAGADLNTFPTGTKYYVKNVITHPAGATLALEPEGIGASDWQDSSTNNLDASYPASGYSVYPDGTGVRITSTENGSSYNFSSIDDGFSASGTHTIRIYDYIADTAVKAITTRCYPAKLPQNPTYPLILYYKVTGMRDHHLQGPSGLAHPRFQVEAWAATYDAAKTLANAIRGALDGYSGTVGTVKIGSILIESERDAYEEAVSCHRIIMDYMAWHSE